MTMEPKDRLIFPLDVSQEAQALELIRLLKNDIGLFKVGLELFVAQGPQFLQTVTAELGVGFFLDLKFHDIPETMARALDALGPGIRFTTIHCEQGPELLRATAAAGSRGVQVLGVTVLTSLDTPDLLAAGIDPRYADPPRNLVLRRAELARQAGCRGVVCSPWEVRAVKERFGPDFLAVCPGVRPAWAAVPGDDQKRVMTPAAAIREGADYLVIGRPIRQAPDPAAAARRVVAEMAAALAPA